MSEDILKQLGLESSASQSEKNNEFVERLPDQALVKKDPIVVLLNNIRSLNNIGSIFRTCDAMAIEKLYLCGITATPPLSLINLINF